jgi:hypothetical protein
VAPVVGFLCTDAAGWINGQVIRVNGGYVWGTYWLLLLLVGADAGRTGFNACMFAHYCGSLAVSEYHCVNTVSPTMAPDKTVIGTPSVPK